MGGRQRVIMVGSILIICQCSMLGSLHFIDDFWVFISISFIAQIAGGIGAGANCTASMAILSSFDSEEREIYIGYIEAANGVGLLFGPLLGAVLYTMGGYTAPFIIFSLLYIACYPFIFHSLNKTKSFIERESDEPTDPSAAPKQDIELKALLVKPRFIFGLLA